MLGLGSLALLTVGSALFGGAVGWGSKPSVSVEPGATYVEKDDTGLLGGLLGDNFLTQMLPMVLIYMMLGQGNGSGQQPSGNTYIYYDDEDDNGRRY